ncbi:hypothetical protein CN311_16000 [Mesorhizobium sanjuanii]|uniref:Uncharacterized protein n=1 Tax=Mesorhizobium sanjuanii TaxID=2037900 RepID=A0A2A6FEJ7_9HYPH|nr:hypothetical protein CN311_16000 [Mesorhizobium sanjuanii]
MAQRRFTIIDVKATRRATAFHKTQVAFYVRILEELLRELELSAPTATQLDTSGEIWRIPDDGTAEGDAWQVERFALAPYLRLVDEFCNDVLPKIAAKRIGPSVDQTFFHLYFKCEQCEYLGHCFKSIGSELPPDLRDVSAVPGLTHEGKRALLRLKVDSVAALANASGLAGAPGIGWSLSRRAPLLSARAKSLASGMVIRTEEEHSFLMPPRADAVLLVSVDHDPVDDRIAAIGYRRIQDGIVRTERIEVPSGGSLIDEAAAMIRVLSALIEDLSEIDASNAALPSGSPAGVYAHIFFYEPAEATNLQQAIGRHLDNVTIREGLLHLVRLFPPEEVVPEPEFRGVHHLPATAIRSVLEQLYALPVIVAYDLRQTSQALALVGAEAPYRPSEAFARPFSSLLSIDVIRPIREGSETAIPTSAIVADVSARLDALQGVIRWLFDQNALATADGRPMLRLAKKPFRFQASFDPLNAADLDVLLACELLENRAGLLDALVGLAQPSARRRDAGRSLAGLTLAKQWKYGRSQILLFNVPETSRESDLGPGDFDLILTDDSPDLRLDPTLWPLVECRIRPAGTGYEDRRDQVQIEVSSNVFRGALFQELMRRTSKGGWYIDRSFRDANTQKAAAFLANLAAGQAA